MRNLCGDKSAVEKTPEQPEKCLYGYADNCYYPIEACNECPARPANWQAIYGTYTDENKNRRI